MQSIEEFFERLDQTEDKKESEDIRFFKAQSCHEPIEDKPVTIKYEVESDFNEEWNKTIQRVLKHIVDSAPGIRFVRYISGSSESDDSSSKYKIKYCLSSSEKLTSKNIYTEII